jgi:FKBP12-rapamycin complex-associated protein
VGPALTKHMHEILDFMFSGGISASLIQALMDLSQHIPPLASTIQERLLNLLSVLLVGHTYQHPGAPNMHSHQYSKEGVRVFLF